jgi:hypothetical protein
MHSCFLEADDGAAKKMMQSQKTNKGEEGAQELVELS